MIVPMMVAGMELVETWINIFQNRFPIEMTIFVRNAVHTMKFGKNERILLKEILYTAGIVGAKSS